MKTISKKLIELKQNKQKIDLLIFTHFDADHISGGIRLFKDNGNYKESKIINIDKIWINTLKTSECDETSIEVINQNNMDILKKILNKRYPTELYSTELRDISAEQCLTISELIG